MEAKELLVSPEIITVVTCLKTILAHCHHIFEWVFGVTFRKVKEKNEKAFLLECKRTLGHITENDYTASEFAAARHLQSLKSYEALMAAVVGGNVGVQILALELLGRYGRLLSYPARERTMTVLYALWGCTADNDYRHGPYQDDDSSPSKLPHAAGMAINSLNSVKRHHSC